MHSETPVSILAVIGLLDILVKIPKILIFLSCSIRILAEGLI
jgi:hypothetical protein